MRRRSDAANSAGAGRAGLPLLTAGLRIVALALGIGLAGCASMGDSIGQRSVRPEASADYDVLVGELAAQSGETEQAREAFVRASEKDPESAYLKRRVSVLSAQLQDLDTALSYAQEAAELDPDDVAGRIFLARLHRIRRDSGAAAAALRDGDGDPLSYEAGLLLFQIQAEQNELNAALGTAGWLVATDPGRIEGHLAVAGAHERLGDTVAVESTLREALEYHPSHFPIYTRLAQLRRGAGDREGEIAVYQEMLELDPDHYGALTSLAETYIALDRHAEARDVYERVIEIYPQNAQLVRRLAGVLVELGELDEAERQLQAALAERPRQYELAYTLGIVQRELGRPEAALATFERVPASHPLFVDARVQVGGIYEDAGDEEASLAEFERVRLLRPDRLLDFHTANLRVRTGDFDGAVELLERMLEESPGDYEVLYQLGVVYGLEKRSDRAIEYMRASLEQNPDNPHALNYIGYSWAERGERLDEAEGLIGRALELAPEDGFITDSLGWVFYMRGRLALEEGQDEEAMRWLEHAREKLTLAAELTGGDPVISEHLGDVDRLRGDDRGALGHYERAVEQGLREDEQPDLLRKLEALRIELGKR